MPAPVAVFEAVIYILIPNLASLPSSLVGAIFRKQKGLRQLDLAPPNDALTCGFRQELSKARTFLCLSINTKLSQTRC